MLTSKTRLPRRTPHAYALARLATGESEELGSLREEVERLRQYIAPRAVWSTFSVPA